MDSERIKGEIIGFYEKLYTKTVGKLAYYLWSREESFLQGNFEE